MMTWILTMKMSVYPKHKLETQSGNSKEMSNSGEGKTEQVNTGVEQINEKLDKQSEPIPGALKSTLDAYWNNSMITLDQEQYVLSAIELYGITAQYGNTSLKSTLQYGFACDGMREFGEMGYKATQEELNDNLIGMGIKMLIKRLEVNTDVHKNALSYLMFLKQTKNRKDQSYIGDVPIDVLNASLYPRNNLVHPQSQYMP